MKNRMLILLVLTNPLFSQEKLGITNSNYSPTNSIFLNPSSSVDSKAYMQLNLAGVGAFFYNNLFYLPSFSYWSLRTNAAALQPKVNDAEFNKFFYANADVNGPAFVISKGNYGAGIFIRARTIADGRNIPYKLSNILLGDNSIFTSSTSEQIDYRNIKFSNMSWLEYGGNFGMILKKQRNDLWTIGGSLRYLTGINISYAIINNAKGFSNDTLIQLDELTGKMRYNTPAFNTGKGFALDVGLTYKKMLRNVDAYYPNSKRSNCSTTGYKYRLAVSLRDLGYIRFTRGGTLADLNASGTVQTSTAQPTSVGQVINDLNVTTTTGKILATMPGNLSGQFDWNYENGFYMNVSLVKNLVPTRLVGVQSPNLLSVTPRFELKNIEVAMPFTWQRFLYPQLGFAVRFRSLVVGLDNLFPAIYKVPKVYGVGVYASLAVTLFHNPACRGRGQSISDCPPNTMISEKISRPHKVKAKTWWQFWKLFKRKKRR